MTGRSRATNVFRLVAAIFGALTLTITVTAAGASTQSEPDPALARRGQDVYGQSCALCHGDRGLGQGEVPAINHAGAAAIDFYISTGRMPLARIGDRVTRGPQLISDADKLALIAYVETLGNGPAIPATPNPDDASLAKGLELFTSNCAACHGPTAAGVAVGQRDVSSPLDKASPLEIAEAIRIGPGVMPVFSEDALDEEEVDAVIAWVLDLRQRAAPGGAQVGRSGPVSEGFVAWIVGMGLLTIVMYMLGERAKDEDDA